MIISGVPGVHLHHAHELTGVAARLTVDLQFDAHAHALLGEKKHAQRREVVERALEGRRVDQDAQGALGLAALGAPAASGITRIRVGCRDLSHADGLAGKGRTGPSVDSIPLAA
jgi:hypothetical protein